METQVKRHEPLFLKHRPQSLNELVGQHSVTTTLTNAIEYDRLTHAYLFTGPRGTGKTSSARILAKSLNCKAFDKPTATPCQKCTSCEEIKQGISPAVLEIDAASNNSVDDARILIERAPLVAPGARFKVYIIDECHMLTKEAFNALLKTIEDPPPNVVFVLATTEEHKVIPTIVSRCQRLMFRLATEKDLMEHLRGVAKQENIEITDGALEYIVRRSGGGLRDALGLLDQASLLSAPGKPADIVDLLALLGALHEDVLLELSDHVLNRRGHELIKVAERLLQEGREPAIIVQEMARHFLNLTKASYLADLPADAAAETIIASPEYLQGLRTQAPQFERSELSQMVEALDKLEQTCRRTTQPAMHLQVGLLSLCHRHDMLLVRELSQRVAALEQTLSGGAPPVVRPTQQSHAPVAAPAPRPQPAPSVQPASFESKPQPAPPVQPAPAPSVPQPSAPAPSHVSSPVEPEPHISVPQHAAVAVATAEPAAISAITIEPASAESGLSPVATISSQPVAPAPKPAEPALQPQAAANVDSDDVEASPDEVDRVWSRVLEELQRRHIPTFSLASVHGVPLSLTGRELILGAKETFVKTLEIKIDHLKAASASAVGRPINVRIRAITMEVSAAKKPTPARAAEREQRPAPEPAPSRQSSPPESDEDYEPAGVSTPEPQPASSQPISTPPNADPAPQPVREPSPSPVPSERGNDGTVIKEAYKLFEGPGSRQIGDKKRT